MFGAHRPFPTENIDFLLLPDFSMIALASAVEPLRAANTLSSKPLYRWRTYSVDGEQVKASNGMTMVPDGRLDEAGHVPTLFVCAGWGAPKYRNPDVDRRLKMLSRKGVALGGICTGSIALARAGLLDGHRCTVHWENVEGFVEEFPELDVTATLFEVDRNRYTCSGGTAPLDMMVNAIATDHGEELGMQVAEFLLHQYVRKVADHQRLPINYRLGLTHPKLLAAIAHMEAYIENPVSLTELADQVGLSTRQLERLFRDKLGKKPSRYYLDLRLQHARLLLRQTTMSVIQVAVASGFSSASHFAKSYKELFGRSPRAERGLTRHDIIDAAEKLDG